MKNTGYIIGGLALLALGVGIYLYKNKSKSSSGTKDKATESDFNDLVDTAKKSGKDIFDGTPSQVAAMKSNFLKNVSKAEYVELKTILSKRESAMTESEKSRFSELWKKISVK